MENRNTIAPRKRQKREPPGNAEVSMTTVQCRACGLCDACAAIFDAWETLETGLFNLRRSSRFGRYVVRNHHWHVRILEESVAQGCGFCTLLRQALEHEGYTSPPSFQRRYKGKGYSSEHRIGELCFRWTVDCIVAEVHFTHEWEAPDKPLGRMEPVEVRDWVPEAAAYFVLLISKDLTEPLLPVLQLSGLSRQEDIIRMTTEWIKECQWVHKACRGPPTFLPRRLLHLHSGGQHLITTGPNDTPVRYATLSHCWGHGAITKLLQSNIESFKRDIPTGLLCRTFVDAIFMASRLGFRHLWIDSLCIIQDDPMDWAQESATMCDVYTHSYLNIAATSASDGSQGCFLERDPSYVSRQIVRPEHGTRQLHCVNSNFYSQNILNTPLGSRAWVVQERLLAPRTVQLGKNQLFWVCQDQIACETYPKGLPKELIRPIDFPDISTGESWRTIITQYSRCNLTKRSDKLVAISGLARKVATHRENEYLAGLWKENLHVDLCWAVSHVQHESSCCTSYVAPTWSWASQSGQVDFTATTGDEWNPQMKVLRVNKETSGNDEYGALRSAALWVTCRFFLKSFIEPRARNAKAHKFGENTVSMVISWDSTSEVDGHCFFCPLVQHKKSLQIQGLVLASTQVEQGEYVRAGLFTAFVEGWPYDNIERVADNADNLASPKDYVADFRDGGNTLSQAIKLV